MVIYWFGERGVANGNSWMTHSLGHATGGHMASWDGKLISGTQPLEDNSEFNLGYWAWDAAEATKLWAVVINYMLGDFPNNLHIVTYWIFKKLSEMGNTINLTLEETEA